MPLRDCNSHFSLHDLSMLLCTHDLSSYIIEFEHFVIFFIFALHRALTYKYNRLNAVYTESLESKRSCLKSLPLTEVFDIDFPFSLPHFLTCWSISLLVNIGKVGKELPHVSVLSDSQQEMVHLYFAIGAWKYWCRHDF